MRNFVKQSFQVTEHIAAAEDFIRGMVTEKVMSAPARPAAEDVAAIARWW